MRRILQLAATFFGVFGCVEFVLAALAATENRWPDAYRQSIVMAISFGLLGFLLFLASIYGKR